VSAALQQMADLGDREFQAIQSRVYARAGICFMPAKRALVAARLQRRVRELALSGFSEYVELALRDSLEEQRMLECLTTHETSFFREPHHFELLERRLAPHLLAEADAGRRSRRVRALSAGCSTGEEPYSLAMSLASSLPGWSVEVTAGDLSSRALARASAGEWPMARAAQIPEPLLRRWFLRGIGDREGVIRASDELRAMLRFTTLNLGASAHPGLGQFDLIFCRNVLIYFNTASKERAVRALLPQLAPGGLFFVGHAESLAGFGDRFAHVVPTVYQLRSAS
jgi:chemotaxis protein methyltransferase CheR